MYTSSQFLWFHFYICCHFKIKTKMKEFSDDAPWTTISSTCLQFRQWIETAQSHLLSESYCKQKMKDILHLFQVVQIFSKKHQFVIFMQKIRNLHVEKNNVKIFNALKKLPRLIRNINQKRLLCSGVRPLRSKWRPDLRSASKSASVRGVWSNLMLFEIFSGPPKVSTLS